MFEALRHISNLSEKNAVLTSAKPMRVRFRYLTTRTIAFRTVSYEISYPCK